MSTLPPLLVIVGPTASGKTDLALELCERYDAEIVSADSVQVYRYFEIGTGKPSAEERARAPHHLLDIVEPNQTMDAARWAELAARAISELGARGKTAIVCGGSFLWVRALIFGLAPAPPASQELRAEHQALAAREGRARLHEQLSAIDPEAAARLAPNDLMRVSRALEVHALTGVPLSRWQAEHGFRTPRFAARLLGVRRSREELDARIRSRVEHMLEAGWIEEVRSLAERGFAGSRAMGSVGYKQISEALASGASLDPSALTETITRATRIFARRQRTWLREEPVEYVDPRGHELQARRSG
jgi:tRNA dimethylallyltransferase